MSGKIFRRPKRPCVAFKSNAMVGTYPSIEIAAKTLGISAKGVSKALNRKKNSYAGYTFRDVEVARAPVQVPLPIAHETAIASKESVNKRGCSTAIQVDAWKDGTLVGIFDSITSASKTLHVSIGSVSEVVSGSKKSVRGYVFTRHKEKEENAMPNDTNEQSQEIRKEEDWCAPGAYESELEWTLQKESHGDLVVSVIRKVYWVPGTYEPPVLDSDVFIRIETRKDGKVVKRFHIASCSSVYDVFKNINRVFSEEGVMAKQEA